MKTDARVTAMNQELPDISVPGTIYPGFEGSWQSKWINSLTFLPFYNNNTSTLCGKNEPNTTPHD
eukprot:423288-Prorocentrum_lima.AAC.1